MGEREEKTSSRNRRVFPLESKKRAKVLSRQLAKAAITKTRERKKKINSFCLFTARSSRLTMMHRN